MKQQWKIILAFAVIYIVWGTTYLAILFAIKDIPPLLLSAMRFFTAGIVLYLFCVAKRERRPNLASLVKNMIGGTLMLAGGTMSVAWAEQYLTSGVAAIIVTAVPFWFVILDYKQWNSNFSNKILIAGLITGFVGVALLIGAGTADYHGAVRTAGRMTGVIVLLAGGIAWTSGSLYAKHAPTGNSILMNSAIQLLFAGLVCLCASVIAGETRHFSWSHVHTGAWLSFAYLTLFGSILTYICYLWLLKVRPAVQVSSYVYINPIVAMILGAMIGKEAISMFQICSLAIILGGVLLINLPKYYVARARRLSVV